MSQISYFFENLFGTSDWPARWHCGKWSDFHGWLYVTSDLLIWGAYFAIPAIKALAQSLYLLEDEIKAAGARLQVHFGVPEVDFPKVYLESVLFNLVSNAIKYQPPGQQPLVIITTGRDGNETVIRVQDNGIGINLNRHKDDLFKYKKVFHSGYKSNGLGLFLTKNQVEVYGGRIEVDSEVGRGSIFSIYFQKIPEDRALIY